MTSDLISNGMETVKTKFSEDCLYLNIYTPADLMKRSRLPVNGGNHWSRLVLGPGVRDPGVGVLGRR